MCGIVGYIGDKEALPILIDELKRLEYRGYDSAGVALLENGKVEVTKKVGKIVELEELLAGNSNSASIGVGHTRWATHGHPSTINAHPHPDCDGKLAVVHNGIIENYLQLKEYLISKGHKFASETDTEVIAHLIEHHYNGDLESAIRKTTQKLEGSYAFVVISEYAPDKLFVARKDSPLVIGLGKGENFIASDIPALLNYTKNVYILEDGDFGIITKDKVTLTNLEGAPIYRQVFKVTWDASMAEKAGYDHFMIKEIHEIPKAIKDTMGARITKDNKINLDEIKLTPQQIRNTSKIFIVACGTAYHAGVVGKYLFEQLLKIPTEVDIASEFRYRNLIYDENTLLIVISQSGETADTLAALREAKRRGIKVLAIVNVVGSSISREADELLYTWAGPEICVASTKAYVTQLIALYLIGLHFATIKGTINANQVSEILADMKLLPQQVQAVLDKEAQLKQFAESFKNCHDFFFLGRGLDYAVSLESALKLKEISYIHSEAYAAGELKHGPLALIIDGIPVMVFATQSVLYDKILSNIKEVNARAATIIGVVKEDDTKTEKSVDYVIKIPKTNDLLMPVLAIIPPYLLTYQIARARNCEIDQPRNLAKSVTVE